MKNSIDCPHFQWCSGCTLNKDVDHPPLLKDAIQYFNSIGRHYPLFTGHVCHWRTRAKLAVRGTSDFPLVGLFKKKTHDTLDIPFCRVHHPSINKAADHLRQWIKEQDVRPYEESTGTGDLRYVQFAVERSTGKVQASLVFNTKNWNEAKLERLWEKEPHMWHSLWVNINLKQTNTIFGSDWHLIKGQELLWEKIGRVEICLLPSSFAQANLEAFEMLLSSLKKVVLPGSRIVEYYAGGGVIGMNMLEEAAKVFCCEINPHSEECFNLSKQKLSDGLQEKITYHVGPAVQLTHFMKEANAVVADPPRKGLEPFFLEELCAHQNIKQFIYISCGWPSFKRDCEFLLNRNWELQLTEGYLFFPGTDHLETLAVFKRS